MEYLKVVAFAAAVLTAGSLLGEAVDTDTKQQCARRLLDRFDLVLDHAKFSLPTLLDIEARLQVCARIRQKHRLIYDYRAFPLDKLQDTEAKLDARDRLMTNYNVAITCEYYTLSQIQDLEDRLKVATRVYQTHGRVLDWKNAPLTQLQAAESSLAEAPQKSPSQNANKALPLSAVAYFSATPTVPSAPGTPTVNVDSTTARGRSRMPSSYAYSPASSPFAHTSTPRTSFTGASFLRRSSSSVQRHYVARVASRPRYTSYYQSSYGCTSWYNVLPIVYGNVIRLGPIVAPFGHGGASFHMGAVNCTAMPLGTGTLIFNAVSP
jgi:hypothetical protein